MGLPAKKLGQAYSYRDYASWPEDERWELIDGIAWNISSAPMRRHDTGEIFEMGDTAVSSRFPGLAVIVDDVIDR